MRYLTVLAIVLGSVVPCQAQNLVPNPEFDTGIASWTLLPQIYTTFLQWDPLHSVIGASGSAVFNARFGPGGLGSTSACIPVTPGVTYSWGGQVRFGTVIQSDFFSFNLAFTSDSSCTTAVGPLIVTSLLLPPLSQPAPWQVLAGPDAVAPPGAVGASVTAVLRTNLDSQAHVVNFDDIYFGVQGTVGPSQATAVDVPTLSPAGLLLLALVLGGTAMGTVRKRRALP